MKPVFLDFEQPIAELTKKIDELRFVQGESAVDISDEITRLQKKSTDLTKSIFSKLTPVQVSQVSRHPQRPYTLDYIKAIFTDFEELHGDRHFADDYAIVGGLARFNGQSVMVIGHQKGRDTKEKIRRNFGMPRPEGYRKALRLMQQRHVQMVLVADEYGGTAGLITMEDLVEEIVGDIQDEHEAQEPPDVLQLPNGSIEFDGMVLLDDVAEQLPIAFDDPEEDTIGGYVFGLLGRKPEIGDAVEISGYSFKVLRTEGFRVVRVLATKLPQEQEQKEEQQDE